MSNNPSLKLLTGFSEVVTVDSQTKTSENLLGIIPNGAIGIEDGKIDWVGSKDSIPEKFKTAEKHDYNGCIAMPGFIDSHTHPVFAGNRADEFEMRLSGKTYLEIAKAGGGILKTMTETRKADFNELKTLTRKRLETMMEYGVSTVECKSGYGLTTESEIKSLQVLKDLQQEMPLDIISTFMGGHDIPPEYKDNVDGYVNLVCMEMIPEVAKQNLAEYNDVFCETGYFSARQSGKILETGMRHGLKPRIHAEEFSDLEGAIMASMLEAHSADHLLHLSDKGVEALAKSKTVATLLPGTAFYLRVKNYAPARKLLDAGATVALATDFNPGSCVCPNLQFIMTLACLQMDMRPDEVIRGVTLNAAKALGREADRGSLTLGKRADIGIFELSTYHELLYEVGTNPLKSLWIKGKSVL